MARTAAAVDDVVDLVEDEEVDETPEGAGEEPEAPETPSFHEAFEAAKKTHAKAEAPVEDDDDEPAAPAPKGRVGKAQRTTDVAPGDQTSLISDAEFAALQTKHGKDPAALRRELEGAFTKKTQALAEQRRSQERLAPYAELVDALESDAEGTILALAQQHGLTVTRPGEKPAETTADTTAAAEAVVTEFRTALGPELEYLADGLAPAIQKLVERLTATTVEKATAPQKQQLDQLTGRAAAEQTTVVMQAFETRHPDWKTHEAALFALSQKLSPKGMTEGEYLDHLYTLVTAESLPATIDTKVAEGVKKTLKRMQEGADTTETRTRATPERAVHVAPPETPTFHEAYQAAKRGERWD